MTERLERVQYKEVWNSYSADLSNAMKVIAASDDEEGFRSSAEVTRQTLEECVGIFPTDVILEIGCGIGRVGQVLAPRCREWIGADVAENMIRHLRKRLQHHSNVRTVVLDGYDLDMIPSESIDLVYCTVVFMHLEEWDRFNYIREGFRVLRPGGRMLVDNMNLLSDKGWGIFETLLNTFSPRERPPQIGSCSTPQELEVYFQRAGFQEIQQRTLEEFIITYGRKP